MTAGAIADVGGWRDLADPLRLAAWMDDAGVGAGAGPIEDARLLTGGTQNLLLQFRRGAREYVLRRPSRHPRPQAGETILREARVLAALAATPVRCPGFVAVCGDAQVLGAAFYLMDPVDGVNIANGLPALHAASPQWRHRMGLEMVDAILTLAAVEPAHAGLAGFGKVEGFLERQVPRWRKQLEGYAECKGWPGPQALPGVEAVGTWLDANRPANFEPGILHGDFHLANVMFRHDGPELAAIVDWELATLGDPLLDLGWLLATWPQPDGSHHTTQRIQPWQGFPEADELIERYATGSRRSLTHLPWYVVMACYKLAIILEGSHARACAGLASREIGDRLHHAAIGLMRKAEHWIETT